MERAACAQQSFSASAWYSKNTVSISRKRYPKDQSRKQLETKAAGWKFWEKEEGEFELLAENTVEVERLCSVRFARNDAGNIAGIEYLVRWTDTTEETWEPVQNIAEDLLRDFESAWWEAAKQGDEYTLREIATGSEEVMASARDKEGRTALHYVCGKGNDRCAKFLLECGADVNAADKDKYTPLHISAGYVHVNTVRTLVMYGADPSAEDSANRSVLELVKNLEKNTPKDNADLFRRRLQLREVMAALTPAVYDELIPMNLLDRKEVVSSAAGPVKDGPMPTETHYLVRWADDEEDEWVPAEDISEDLLEDFEAGLEYADGSKLLDKRTVVCGDVPTLEYLVEWSDGEEPSWEPESHVAELLVREYEEGIAGSSKTGHTEPELCI